MDFVKLVGCIATRHELTNLDCSVKLEKYEQREPSRPHTLLFGSSPFLLHLHVLLHHSYHVRKERLSATCGPSPAHIAKHHGRSRRK